MQKVISSLPQSSECTGLKLMLTKMKKDQYFSLEVNLMSDDAVATMMYVLEGGEAFGVYVALLTHLRKKDGYESSCSPLCLEAIAALYNLRLETVQRVLCEFGLFVIDEERMTFRSPYLNRVMDTLEQRWKTNQENGKKGGRPAKSSEAAETPETPEKNIHKPNHKPNLTKENKRELKSTITTVEYNSSNSSRKQETAAVAVAPQPAVVNVVPPLEPVCPWESLVDEMGTCQEYLCIVASHSGLGKLFIDHRQRILELFKQHIRLYGKEGGMLGLKDVKQYFSNFIAMGSVTGRKLREALLTDQENAVRQEPYRYETMERGRRMCLGRVIPNEAPPRPDHLSVWNEKLGGWTR